LGHKLGKVIVIAMLLQILKVPAILCNSNREQQIESPLLEMKNTRMKKHLNKRIKKDSYKR
jgi:hypothetical protein